MTALCGGGTSAPKLGVDAVLAYSVGRIGQLLVESGIGEFNPALPLIFTIPIIANSFCGTDPPAMTALTQNEANAVINLTFGSDLTNGLGKLKDIILNLIWLDICECTSGSLTPPTTPATPANVTVFLPPSTQPVAPIGQGWYPMDATARVLALGCGSPARPAGYQNPTFDDSAWTLAVPPTTLFAGTWAANQSQAYNAFGVSVGSNASLPGSIFYIAPADPLAHNCEQWLIRWKVFLPNITPSAVVFRLANGTNFDGGWSSGTISVNGKTAIALNATSGSSLFSALIPNQWNVIAIDVNPSNTASANTWGTHGGVSFGLDFTSGVQLQNTQPCCPPDVTAQSYLDLILQTVTLIQRQAVPFAYVVGTQHVGLTGAGTIAISGLLGASVELTTIPTRLGEAGSSPTEIFDAGWVTFGTPDGFPSSYRLGKQHNVFLPSRCSAYTELDYDLPTGVVVTISELVREP